MRTRLEVKRIELFSLFKVAFYVYAIMGLFFGLIYGFFLLLAGGIQSAFLGEEFPHLGAVGIVIGILAIPFIALIYGAIGSVFITIGGWIFNIICGAVGGLRFETVVEEAYEQPIVGPSSRPVTQPSEGGSISPPGGPTITRSTSLDDE